MYDNGVVEVTLVHVSMHCAVENGSDLHVNERQKVH